MADLTWSSRLIFFTMSSIGDRAGGIQALAGKAA